MSVYAFQPVSQGANPSLFTRNELGEILKFYGEQVTKDIWKDYGIICGEHKTTFVIIDNSGASKTDIRSIAVQKTPNKSTEYVVGEGDYYYKTSNFGNALDKFKEGIVHRPNKKPKFTVV